MSGYAARRAVTDGSAVDQSNHPAPPRRSRSAAAGQSGRPAVARRLSHRLVLIIVLVVAAVAAAAGATYAWWMSSTSQTGAVIQSGDMRMSVDTNAITWTQATPGVSTPAHGTLASTPIDFVTQPGEIVRIVAPVTTTLKGDNLQGALTVEYDPSVTPDPDLTVTFHVEDANGTQVAPASGDAVLGESVVVPNLLGDDAGVPITWNIVVTVVVGGEYVWAGDPASGANSKPAGSWTVGTLDFRLLQVRGAASSED